MATASDKHERTIAFAEVALRQIKALRQPAEPRDYEIWYTYATGYNPSLNKAINDTLARAGNLSSAEVEAIYGTYLSPTRSSARIDTVGAKVADEIEQVMSMIDQAVGSTSSYSESLADVTQQLGTNMDRDGLRAIVESLVQTTKEAERSNQALEARLKSSRQEIQELHAHLEAIRHESLTDPLTGLANRKAFDQSLAPSVAAALANRAPMAVMMLDIDHFKSFNDTYGHLTGDQVLRLVAQCVKATVKGQDIPARYGGEEFTIILPNTSLRDAVRVAEHVRSSVMSKELMKRSTGESLGRVTVSIGVASCLPGDTPQSLLERADTCLYAAKRAGRNQVMSEMTADVAPAPQTRVA
jgi:diguanylate cyclase